MLVSRPLGGFCRPLGGFYRPSGGFAGLLAVFTGLSAVSGLSAGAGQFGSAWQCYCIIAAGIRRYTCSPQWVEATHLPTRSVARFGRLKFFHQSFMQALLFKKWSVRRSDRNIGLPSVPTPRVGFLHVESSFLFKCVHFGNTS